jgi:type I restriction enzyme S subunit
VNTVDNEQLTDNREWKETEIGRIPKEWKLTSLEELSKRVKVGFVGSCNKFYCDETEGVPMIRTTNLTKSKVILENLKFIQREFHEKNIKSQLNKNDILIARHGSNGMASLWEEDIQAQCLNVVVVETDNSKGNCNFLTYAINSPIVNNQVLSMVGGSVQGVINTKSIAQLLIPTPNLDEQQKIASILKSLDDKIELNNQMNATLEEMAQSIFKEWFVEFNFPNEEGVPYKDNGGEMVESELEKIPEGWRIEELGNISTFNYGKMPKKSLLNTGDFPTYSGYKYQYSYPEYNCEKKDLIVVARGVGGTGDVKLVKEKCYLTNLSIKFSLNENSNLKEYLYYKLDLCKKLKIDNFLR